jgi:hypothetical protein
MQLLLLLQAVQRLNISQESCCSPFAQSGESLMSHFCHIQVSH